MRTTCVTGDKQKHGYQDSNIHTSKQKKTQENKETKKQSLIRDPLLEKQKQKKNNIYNIIGQKFSFYN